ncbi:hypothetical protein MLD38_016701 [Melastoma candidum]|uniref:Uncharacterized protein n=1 Tax=Melastoma candidum TaxID=119954 RepID=A0ACB9QMK2_9MYRT|nr:hypothetical protein MLD38_016701 [Melastoma candidum]
MGWKPSLNYETRDVITQGILSSSYTHGHCMPFSGYTRTAVSQGSATAMEADVQALKAMKRSIINDPTRALADWDDQNHHCNWSGISGDPSSTLVVSISLVDKQLEGNITPFVGNISGLLVLDLTLNGFTRSIPEELGRCSHFQVLIQGRANCREPFAGAGPSVELDVPSTVSE